MGEERRIGTRAEQKRRWDEEHRLHCEICGERVASHGRDGTVARCVKHHVQRERADARRERIIELWRDGKTCAEIAADLSTTVGSISVDMARMRRQGYDLPHRHRTSQSLDLTGEQTLGSARASWPSTAGPGGSRGFSTAEGAG